MPQLARRMGRAKPSAIMAVAEKAKALKAAGRDIISFSIGVPNFLPGDHVYAAARERWRRIPASTAANRGSDALLDAFLKHIEQVGLTGYTRANCSTGIGAKHVLYNLAEALLDEGDTIALRRSRTGPRTLDIADIVNAKSTRAAVPGQPELQADACAARCGAGEEAEDLPVQQPEQSDRHGLHARTEIAALAEVLVKYPDTWIVADDIYNRMVFDGIGYHNFVHAQPTLRERMIFVDSLSKTYGMPGWRVGFMVGPEIVAKARDHAQLQPHHQHPGSRHRRGCRRADRPAGRADREERRIPGQARPGDGGDGFDPRRWSARGRRARSTCSRTSAVAFGKSHGGTPIGNDVDFCNALLEAKGVACVPGSAFGEPRALRICYTCPTRAAAAKACSAFQEFFAELRNLISFNRSGAACADLDFPRNHAMKSPVRVAVTGAAGQIGYSLVFRIASGEMLGKDQPVILQMLELPMEKAQAALKGVMMELEDCAFPLLAGMVGTDDAEVAFKDADIALLVGARPRGPGMERKDLLLENAKIFTAQGAALNKVASRDVKVLVVGNPANTNAYIAMKSAPDLNPKNFTAMLRLDHNRALSQLASQDRHGRGRHREAGGVGQPQPDDVSGLPLRHRRRRVAEGQDRRRRLEPRTPSSRQVGKRGAAIIEARGLSSAASAANAAIDHIRDWVLGSNGKWITMGVPSDGSYGIPKDVMYGFPVTSRQRRVRDRAAACRSTTSAAP